MPGGVCGRGHCLEKHRVQQQQRLRSAVRQEVDRTLRPAGEGEQVSELILL